MGLEPRGRRSCGGLAHPDTTSIPRAWGHGRGTIRTREPDRIVWSLKFGQIPLSGVAKHTPHASRRTHETCADRLGSFYPGDRPLWAGICRSLSTLTYQGSLGPHL